MPLYACLSCGRLSPQTRCPEHRGNTSWAGNRDRATQARFRKAVLTQAGNQCQAIIDGIRCTATTSLEAHHTVPGDNRPETGVALCNHHHRAIDRRARPQHR